ncbi:GntR family transcriptional regulator [Georgenia alba]|uniref:GntR family transcriptional regulator n=1 Tax=Georgenia alba TaxID=2233858 RepID=A0ABW2QAC5_9MICO
MRQANPPDFRRSELTGPLYRVIAARLRHKILSGELAVGDVVPSEQELCREHGVSRMTARQAVTELVNQGLLRREQGRGTFVTERKLVRGLSSVSGLREDLEREGLHPGGKVLSLERRRATRDEATRLHLSRASDVWRLVRSRTADEVVLGLQIAVLPVHLAPDLDTWDLDHGSLYRELRARGLPLTWARQRIEAVVDPEVSDQLELPAETAYLRVSRISLGPERLPVELLVSYFVGSSYAYDVELTE